MRSPLRALTAVAFALFLAPQLHAQTAQAAEATQAAAQPGAPAVLPAVPTPPAQRDIVGVDTTPGYARILFTFQRPAPVSASIADGVLTIRLARPVDTTIDRFTASLGPYVSNGRRDEDGLTYRFALAHPVALHTSTQVNQTAVDLVPDAYKAVPPDLPPPPPPVLAKRELPDVSKLAAIKVRVAEYANFTRLVFDWPMNVAYTAYPGQGRISLRFETMARPDFSMLEGRKPAWIKSAGWHLDGTTTVVDFDTDAESTFHDFRDGMKIAVDVLAPKTDASAYAQAGSPRAIPISPAPSATVTPPPKGSDAAAATAVAKIAAIAGPAVSVPAASTTPPPATQMTSDIASPSVELTRDGAALHFPAARGHGSAVFTRGDTLWIVLDGHPPIDVATLLSPFSGIINHANADQISGAEVLRLVFKSPLLATVTENEAALNIALAAGATTPPEAIAFTRQGADGQPTLTATLPGSSRAIALADSEAGDHLFVVPARPGKGNLTPKRFVEMTALPTASGLAVVSSVDDLSVLVRDDLVTFSRPRGLTLSAASGASTEPVVQMLTSKQGPAFVDFGSWGKAEGKTVRETIQHLRDAVARLPESEGNKARLQLARYLLAHDLAPEALGETGLIMSVDPKLANDPSLLAMRGAAQYMMGRYADARSSLSGGSLGNDPHAAMWRGMAEAKLADYTNARHDLAASLSVLRYYPQVWQTRARLARAETGIAQGDLASANDALDQLPPDIAPRDSVEAKLYAAQLLAKQGHINEALARLVTLEQTDYAPIAARATYVRVDTQLQAKRIAPKQAIDALDRLRYRWRGDDLELNVLRKLGSLYFDEKDWRGGLGMLRSASLNFPNAELGRQAQDDMRKAFNDLFLGDKSDAMPPVQALALFYDFIELTPIGREGDEMIRRLSDRLVSVDLLGPAEQLLDHQVSQRLDGVARAAVATRLAMIYLLDHKPKEALAAINDTRQTRLPDDIGEQRRVLEARALAGLKQYDSAIDLIADDDTPEAKHLRADIYWEAGNWAVAGAKSEDVLGNRWNVSGPLSNDDRAQVMRAAVAYSLGGDQASLSRLRERYGEKMSTSPDARSFGVVTEPIGSQGVAFRDLAKSIASVDTLQAFMTEFKKQGAPAPATEPKTASN